MAEDPKKAFESLIGERVLTGVDLGTCKGGWDGKDDCNLIRFVLDGVTWEAMEDPEDGYRSCLGIFEKSGVPVKNVFEPCWLRVEYFEGYLRKTSELLRGYDLVTGRLVLEVGTDNTNDYYPYFVANFDPTAMAANNKDAIDA